MARHICILLHGIETDPSVFTWAENLQLLLTEIAPDIEFYTRKYGYVSGWKTRWSFYREKIVEHERTFFHGLRDYLPEDAKISVFAHSLGGHIAYSLLSDFKFHRIILMQAAAPEDADWKKLGHNFGVIHNWWSPNDAKLRWSNYGQIGLVGALNPHPRVVNHRMDWLHDEFQDDHWLYDLRKEYIKELS